MATQAAKRVVLDLCGELLGREPRRWCIERLNELAEYVDNAYNDQSERSSPRTGLRLLDTLPKKAA